MRRDEHAATDGASAAGDGHDAPAESARRLRVILEEAAAGRYPPADGGVELLPPLPGPVDAVCSFTAHHVIATAVPASLVGLNLDMTDLSAPMSPAFLGWLAAVLGSEPGSADLVLVADALPAGGSLDEMVAVRPVKPDLAHPRIARAARYRSSLRVWETWDGAGVLILGHGLAGRWEVSFEVDAAARDRGLGTRLAAAARRFVPAGQHVFAQVAPGNARSLRAVLAAGYRPIGGEVLFFRSSAQAAR